MAKLAIRGDKTRGDQVLTILKMLGGTCIDGYSGAIDIYGYFIRNTGIIDCTTYSILNNANYKLYTIDEFWAEFPYKVGDKVHILCKDKDAEVMSANWDSNMECVHYCCLYDRIYHITARAEDLLPIAKEDMDIAEILKNAPKGTKLYSPICGECYLIEVSKDGEFIHVKDSYVANPITLNKYGKSSWKDSEILLFPSAANRNWSTLKVEPQFPTTVYDCSSSLCYEKEHYKKRKALYQLLICRDAWWKVDGDWKPDWEEETMKYGIVCAHNKITKDYTMSVSMVLSFRTEEIRDKFLEIFRDLIEQCKELI